MDDTVTGAAVQTGEVDTSTAAGLNGPATQEQASLTASSDQNGTTDTDPLATDLSNAVGDEAEQVLHMPPEAEAALKSWLRANIMWVQTEIEHARIGTPLADRAKLNP